MKIITSICAIGLLIFSGCSTPASRIEQSRVAFDRATPVEQELIKKGKVGMGFDQELVELAVGAPDRVWERTDKTGKKTIWSYVTYETSVGGPLYRGWYHRWYMPSYYDYYSDYGDRVQRERIKITFEDGKVVSIEQEK